MYLIKQNVFGKAAIVGLLLIAISLWMMIAGQLDTEGIWLPAGFKVPILALEFASSQATISKIIESLSKESVESIRLVTHIDMAFLLVYNLFLILVLNAIYVITNLKQYKWISLLPVVVMLADVVENIQIYNALDGLEVNIVLLQISTWTKWLGLAALFTLVGRFLITTGRYYDRVLALATFVTLPLGIWAMISPGSMNEVFAMLFYLLFPMAIIYTWFSGIRKTA